MADAEEKAKAERLAAARKRAEQMKKKKKKKAAPSEPQEDTEPAPAAEPEASTSASKAEIETPAPEEDPKDAASPGEDSGAVDMSEDHQPASPSQSQPASLAEQLKLRSASFRQGSVSAGSGPLSPGSFGPEGETATDIYKKHVARIEELEKENKRLAKEAADAEKRWKKVEEELADLREEESGQGSGSKTESDSLVENLKSEIASLERQNSQLQQQLSRSGSSRQGVSPSASAGSPPAVAELEASLASKSATIEAMELEISKLRALADRPSSEREQIAALEERVNRSEKAASLAQRELADVRRNLDRTTEKVIREGSERTSAETKLRALEHDLADAMAARIDAETKVDDLEKKVATLKTLHKEHDARTQALRRDKERAEKELKDLKSRAERLEGENAQLRSRRSVEGGGGLDDDDVDELENEVRMRLEKKVRDLEAEVHDLRNGVWLEKRRELGAGQDFAGPGAAFQDVDLGAPSPGAGARKGSSHHPHGGGGLTNIIQSGLNVLTGHTDDDVFLEDEDMDFDEDAFRRAHEEEAKARLERIKEIKRGLKNWEGWRLDIVDLRRGGQEGFGDIFDV
ncbi:hypothetical protein ACRALDRAFT_2040268 [Sodiomyces alcalophilus JCM 7366]|uniref:uncharacterized protein n=1 Tax=Sodiomyces alcalophilus JCM 7366 TaxID=591952 RepID=UPI0039B41E11